MSTRTMGLLILGIGCVGLVAGLLGMVQGPTIANQVSRVRLHMLSGLISMLVVTLALSWLALFAFGSWRALLAKAQDPDHRARTLSEGKRALYRIVASAVPAVALGVGNFVLGFDVYAGELSSAAHVALATGSVSAQALALVLALVGLRTLEDLADAIDVVGG